MIGGGAFDRSDVLPVAVALAAALGAWVSWSVPLVVAAPLAAGAVALGAGGRRGWRWAAPVGVGVLASALGAVAVAGLVPPAPTAHEGEVTLVRDPVVAWGAVRAEVRGDGGRRCEVLARGGAGGVLRHRQAGEVLHVRGRLEPVDEPWLAVRHVACRMHVGEVVSWSAGHPVTAAANGLRTLLLRGAHALPIELRGLYGGFVLGDTREQLPETADDFRSSGLTHLLAVSGQNVSLVVASAAPLLGRLGLRSRLVVTLGLLGFFALVTRFEPSVLRATTMAGLAAIATCWGRPASGRRLLAGAVALLLLADPFLVRSVGFGLSVAASMGILVGARPVADALPGPTWLTRPVGVVVAAQLGVAPVLIPVFGGLPVASLPANLLAGPVAGLVMVWGVSAGLVAGVVGEPLAVLAHLPTRAALSWVAGVARWSADLPLGALDARTAALAGGALVVAVVARARRRARSGRRLALVAFVVALAAVAWPGFEARRAPPEHLVLPGVGELWTAGGAQVLVLEGRARPGPALAALRPRARGSLDLVVAPTGGTRQAEVVAALRSRLALGEVWAPATHRLPAASTPRRRAPVRVGGLVVEVGAVAPKLAVEVRIVAV